MTDSDWLYLRKHRAIWNSKAVLRRLYQEQFYAPLLANRSPGTRTLEIGSGPGFLREIDPSVWRTDILHTPWIHCTADAHYLPFPKGVFDNVIGLDVLHHFNRPVKVLREIVRVLRPGGRCVLVEPWITPFSCIVYSYLHHEQCDLKVRPWQVESDLFERSKQAFHGNAAVPYLLIQQGLHVVEAELPNLRLALVQPFSSLTYLLSLGFKRVSLLPDRVYSLLFEVERATLPLWRNLFAMRALIVWEKRS